MNQVILEGQVGNVRHIRDDLYGVDIAENLYKKLDGEYQKTDVIWYNCICFFKPSVEKGDRVMARCTFQPCSNKNYPFSIVIQKIGKITKERKE